MRAKSSNADQFHLEAENHGTCSNTSHEQPGTHKHIKRLPEAATQASWEENK
jgi:hypothetical protein